MGVLAGALAKLARADEHIRCLDEEIDRWTEVRRKVTTESKEPEGAPVAFRHFIEFDPVPDVQGWALLIGDAVHNLRSALDHVVYECSEPNPPKGVEFPVIIDPCYMVLKASDRRSYRYKIRGIENEVVRTIIYRAQPWRRPDRPDLHTLWVLQQMDIQDKHRLLTPVAGSVIGGDVKGRVEFHEVGDHRLEITGPEWVPFDHKAEFVTLETGIPPKRVDMKFSFDYVMSVLVDSQVLPLQSTLGKVREYARGLVEEIGNALV